MGAWVLALGAGPIGHLQVGLLAATAGAGLALAANGAVLVGIALLTVAVLRRRR